MSGSYILGVCAAIAAGITFNLGMLIQKVAVQRTRKNTGLIRQLTHSPLWLGGFALQFIIGMPLNMLAQAYVGPAIIPGLMAIGLVVLAIGAVRVAHESLSIPDMLGISLVILAIALFGLSELGVDMGKVDLYEPAFVIRLAVFSLIVALMSLTCYFLQSSAIQLRGLLRTLDAGLLFVQNNLWLGVLVGFFTRWNSGQFSAWDLLPVGAASAITFAGSMLGITETQRAFQVGEASKLVPIQNVPVQILPIISYFAVFQLTPPDQAALPLAGVAIAFILAGSALLARRQVALI